VHALFEVCNDRLAVPARVRPEHTAIATAASPTPRLFRSITSEGQHCLFDRSSGSPTARIWRRQAPLALERPLPNSRPSNGRSSMSALLPYRSLSRSPSCRLDVSNWPTAGTGERQVLGIPSFTSPRRRVDLCQRRCALEGFGHFCSCWGPAARCRPTP